MPCGLGLRNGRSFPLSPVASGIVPGAFFCANFADGGEGDVSVYLPMVFMADCTRNGDGEVTGNCGWWPVERVGQKASGRWPRERVRGFSLIELMLAIFVLATGLVILAILFPIAADWTRESVDHTLAQSIARNAVALIRTRYIAADFANLTDELQPPPGLGGFMSISNMSYRFPSDDPMSSVEGSAAGSRYFWLPLVRTQRGLPQGMVDVYIIVVKKGEASQLFTKGPGADPKMSMSALGVTPLYPTLWRGPYRDGTYVPAPGEIVDPVIFPPVGDYGIGVESGTVFRQRSRGAGLPPAPSTPLIQHDAHLWENVLYVPPADGTNESPVIYVYQTSVMF